MPPDTPKKRRKE